MTLLRLTHPMLEYQGEHDIGGDTIKVWRTERGELVTVHRFDMPPDLPREGASFHDYEQNYRQVADPQGTLLLDVLPCRVNYVSGLATVVKIPQTPSGLTFIGAITIPFQDLSFVVKIQCPELSTTGMREAVWMDHQLQQGLDPSNYAQSGPYSPEFDAHFPDHPLSRVRLLLPQLIQTLQLDPQLRQRTPFGLPF